MAQKPQKGAADAAAKLIAKYGKAAVSSAVRNFKPAAKVKVTPIKGTGKLKQYPKSNVKPMSEQFIKKDMDTQTRFKKEKRDNEKYRYDSRKKK